MDPAQPLKDQSLMIAGEIYQTQFLTSSYKDIRQSIAHSRTSSYLIASRMFYTQRRHILRNLRLKPERMNLCQGMT